MRYELEWCKNSSPELLCSKVLPHKLILRLEATPDSGPGVAAAMVQNLLDAHHRINEELARKTRAYERKLAAKDLASTSLKKQRQQENRSPTDRTNRHVNPEGTSSRGKRKDGAGNTETRSRK
jgi:hypothetical protein